MDVMPKPIKPNQLAESNKTAGCREPRWVPWFVAVSLLITVSGPAIKAAQPATAHNAAVRAVAFSPSGSQVASGDEKGVIKIWDLGTGGLVSTVTGHSNRYASGVLALRYSPKDATLLASAGTEDSIKLWDASNGRMKAVLPSVGAVTCLAFSPDGRWMASGGARLVVWNIAEQTPFKVLASSPSQFYAVIFSPDGKHLAAGSGRGWLTLWDTALWQPLKRVASHGGAVATLDIAPDNELLLSAGYDGMIRLWRVQYMRPLRSIPSNSRLVYAAAFSPDGEYFVTGGWKNRLKVWRLGEPFPKQIDAHKNLVTAIAFSPNGTRLLSGSADRSVKLWEMPSGIFVREFR